MVTHTVFDFIIQGGMHKVEANVYNFLNKYNEIHMLLKLKFCVHLYILVIKKSRG